MLAWCRNDINDSEIEPNDEEVIVGRGADDGE
jgi:hypothetical protein